MVDDWISKANARQRAGRAGRVKPGLCFSLYTRHRFEKLMRPYQVPEMLRVPLVELCLQIKLLGLGYIKPFLSKEKVLPLLTAGLLLPFAALTPAGRAMPSSPPRLHDTDVDDCGD
ncbi:hypothetical protein F2Q70_00025931 [Brassica cretica]|uniref:RNA helicase n=1 Tax=Brassica cretica TaxID=69181 RepID=A0A8S9L815_BRACR|nr:hypothetical protein F2Q70_00025931 [Brassica cretica]